MNRYKSEEDEDYQVSGDFWASRPFLGEARNEDCSEGETDDLASDVGDEDLDLL